MSTTNSWLDDIPNLNEIVEQAIKNHKKFLEEQRKREEEKKYKIKH